MEREDCTTDLVLLSVRDGIEPWEVLLHHLGTSLVLSLGRHTSDELPEFRSEEVNHQSGGDESPFPPDSGELEG